jgi:hypothetical protein
VGVGVPSGALLSMHQGRRLRREGGRLGPPMLGARRWREEEGEEMDLAGQAR